MQTVVVKAKKRENKGKKDAKLLRRDNQVPCVLYGGDENVQFHANYVDFKDLVYTDKFVRAEIDIDGKKHKAILKDIQFHPVTDRILHIDFLELVENKPIITELPINTTGFSEGVREGGVLQLRLRKIKVKALPKDLPEAIHIDVTTLNLGHSIKIEDIKLDGVEILHSDTIAVVGVEIPRALKSATTAEEAEEAEAAEAAKEGEGEAKEGEEAKKEE